MLNFPTRNLPRESVNWAQRVEQYITNIDQIQQQSSGNNGNTQLANASTMKVLGAKIANLASAFAAAIAGLTFAANQITPGTFVSGVILPAANISGAINTGASIQGLDLYTTNGPGFNITGTRVASWLETATGRIGMATSSARYKTAIVDATTDPKAILGISVKYYQYIAEVAKRDDPESEGYVGPDYHVATNIGAIAEDFDAAGLWEFVVYQRDADGNLVLDDNSKPIPDGLHYEILSVGVLIAAQSLDTRLTALEAKVAQLEGSN